MKIKIMFDNNMHVPSCCGVCGQAFDLDGVPVELVDGHSSYGYLCPLCIRAERSKVAMRARERAHVLIVEAASLLSLAVDIDNMRDDEWIDMEQYEQASRKANIYLEEIFTEYEQDNRALMGVE